MKYAPCVVVRTDKFIFLTHSGIININTNERQHPKKPSLILYWKYMFRKLKLGGYMRRQKTKSLMMKKKKIFGSPDVNLGHVLKPFSDGKKKKKYISRGRQFFYFVSMFRNKIIIFSCSRNIMSFHRSAFKMEIIYQIFILKNLFILILFPTGST